MKYEDRCQYPASAHTEFVGAARAVGHACGSNELAFIVPCHRVVRADGTPGGWRWGVARKQKLLKSEARANPQN